MVEVVLGGQRTVGERGTQGCILGMGHEALAQGQESILNPTAQVFPRPGAFLATCRTPGFQGAVRGWLPGFSKAGIVHQQPQGGEIGVAFLGEYPRQVSLDPGGSREAGIVAQDAQRVSVRDQAPQRLVDFVQVLLGQTKSGAAPAAIAELGQGRLQTSSGRRDDHGNALALGGEPDGERPIRDLDGRNSGQRGKTETVAQERHNKALGKQTRVRTGGLARDEVLPMRLGHAPVAADLVAQVQAFGNGVVGVGLVCRLQLGHSRKPVRGQQATLYRDCLEGELGFLLSATDSHGDQSTRGSRT